MNGVNVQFPAKLEPLFTPSRYKVIYGGRGGGKSWGIARALLLRGVQAPERILCGREFQSSISDSVHKLLADQIDEMGLGHFYTVEKAKIYAANGTEFRFAGIRTNVSQIKSFEGITIAWIEEAANVSKSSWETLIPTIRREGSEIWCSFNPELDTDETYRRFVLSPPAGAVVIKMNYSDNPYFPEVLKGEAAALKARDPDAYLTVWEGHCRQTLDGAIYANEIRRATEEGRICRVPYEPGQPVHTFWDLGRADNTSIWFVQRVGFQTRVIDFYEANGHALAHYLKELQSRQYVYGTLWLPHDATHQHIGAEMTIERQARAAGFNVRIVGKVSIADGINAARTLFDNCYFDAERTADGLQSLRRYQYATDDNGARSRLPLHNEYSHAADAFRYLALGLRERAEKKAKDFSPDAHMAGGVRAGWMA